MNVLSLFDGISCGRVALDRAGIEVNNYYASEIDKYAIQVSKNNYPDIIRMGDINNWQEWNIDWSSIDLILAGSPCQSFSMAGKQLAFNDPRGQLFFVFVNILNQVKKFNPNVKFLLENVRMKKEYIQVINECLGVEPVLINSALVSAQNRQRLYWANWEITQPEDKGILLKDIIHENNFHAIKQNARGKNKGNLFCEKSPTLTSSRWEQNNFVCSEGWHDWWNKNKQFQEKKSYSQICNGKDKAITLTARMYASWNGDFFENGNNIRKLTPIECERLQTLPDNYTQGISNSQRYKCLGNGWTVDVIAHILKSINDTRYIPVQNELFMTEARS